MAWQDREYNSGMGGRSGNPLWNLLAGSIPIGTLFHIRIRIHASLVLFAFFTVLLSPLGNSGEYGYAVKAALTSMVILFGIVLLHEFGHCFAARAMGGHADDILLSPIGGLASTSPPRRPWPVFVTVACGPLVNVLICVLTSTALWGLNRGRVAFNPLTPLTPFKAYFHGIGLSYYLYWIYLVSWALLLFNLLPIYPLDGGQMLQTILWPKLGYFRSMMIATITGMVGAVVVGIIGLAKGYFLLVFVALIGFQYCFQKRLMLKQMGPYGLEEDGIDYSSSLRSDAPHRHRLSRRVIRKARRRAAEEQAEQGRIDDILAKVSAHGMHSLTWWERRTLKKATARQRERDLEMSRADRD